MTRILLPTDFSDTAFKAAQFAMDLYGVADTRYTLVHAYLKPSFDNALLPSLGSLVDRESMNGLRRMERKCRKHAGKVHLSKVGRSARLVDVVNELVRKPGADMIVMGTQGEGNYGTVGSNTSAVVLGAQAPVITVPAQWKPARIQRILLAYDGGPVDADLLRPLKDLAERCNAEVVVTHVRREAVDLATPLDRKAVSAALGTIEHSFLTVHGEEVATAMDELARGGRVQLVALVHRKRGFWSGLFHASNAKRMALHTALPVLVLR
ncbi:MAG: universal stress protein [Flavobacteriales bacterium]